MVRIALLCLFIGIAAAQKPDFARDVHPILEAHCAGCHTGPKAQASLALNTRAEILKGGINGPAVVPGTPSTSLLIQRVTGRKPPVMPLGADPLSAAEIRTLERWIEDGAIGPESTPATASRTVPLAPRRPAQKSIDAILAGYFRKHSITTAPPVSDAVFVRRAYLDLWGLLPTPEQRDEFLNDTAKDKQQALIQRLLANRRNYAEHWISFWDDLLHNDEGVSYVGDRKTITPWLLKSLEENLPYNEFVSALLNPEKKDDPAGFLIGVNWRGDVNASQTPIMQAAQNSAQVFLGVNLKCNSCHDSFISTWKLKDAYGLASFFSKEPLELVRCDIKTGKTAELKFLYPELGKVDPSATLPERQAAAARLFTSPQNGRFTRTFVNRIWRKLMGRGIVEPADDMDAQPWDEDLLDFLAVDFADHNYDVQYLLTSIMTSIAYRLPPDPAVAARDKSFIFSGPQFRRLEAEQFADAVSSITGEWRISAPRSATPGAYSREWRLKSNSLSRALGRPIRDLAVTERLTDPNTLQTLELVNGNSLATLLHLGAERMLGQTERIPANIYDSGVFRSEIPKVDVDITGAKELHLLLVDVDSYDLSRVTAGWIDAELVSATATTKLATIRTTKRAAVAGPLTPNKQPAVEALISGVPNELVYDLKGQNFKRFRATIAIDSKSLTSEISPAIRAFVFTEEPNRRQMINVTGEPPVDRPPALATTAALITRVYRHALGRDPSAQESAIAAKIVGEKPTAQGLEDLLWSILLSPEFQYVS
jgi:hypothetical protein